MAEASLSETTSMNNSFEEELIADIPKPPNVEDIEEELPWCAICNEDATLRCKDCDGQLYCGRCYKEYHDNEEYQLHTKEKYRPLLLPRKLEYNPFI